MKKHITRTLSIMLAVIMLMSTLTVNASAIKIHVNEDGSGYVVEETPTDTDIIEYYGGYRNPYMTGPDRPQNGGGTKGFVYYMNSLRQYMPHVTDDQLAAVTPYCNPRDGSVTAYGWVNIAAAADLHAYFDSLPELRKQLPDYRYELVTSGTASELYTAHLLAGEVNDTSLGLVDTHDMSDEQLAALRAGGFLDFMDQYDGYDTRPNLGFTGLLSESMHNDTTVRNVRISDYWYFGENVFRNSAIETVVFADAWISDHRGADGHTTARAQNGLFFGKEAIIIEANSFADCANLKSVIIPCEPARLYLADGVFANCPNLTVYAPAGGKFETYCKVNDIKFSPIANGYIEPKIDTQPYVAGASITKNGMFEFRCVPVANFDNSVAMYYYTSMVSYESASYRRSLLDRDINRYRSEAIRANDLKSYDTRSFGPTTRSVYTDALTNTSTGTTEPASGQAQNPSIPAMPNSAWYKTAMTWAYENGLVSTSLASTFAPDSASTRAAVVEMLYNQAGRPDVSSIANPFTDVSDTAWYADAVKWAASNGIVSGIGDGKFAPEATLTRAQIVQILYNQAGHPDASKLANPFTDVAGNAWYASAVKWAAANSIVSGIGNGQFAPEASLTYAQIAQILYNMR